MLLVLFDAVASMVGKHATLLVLAFFLLPFLAFVSLDPTTTCHPLLSEVDEGLVDFLYFSGVGRWDIQ